MSVKIFKVLSRLLLNEFLLDLGNCSRRCTTPSIHGVVTRYAGTYSLRHTTPGMESVERRRTPKPSYRYDSGREHTHNAPVLRNNFVNLHNMRPGYV